MNWSLAFSALLMLILMSNVNAVNENEHDFVFEDALRICAYDYTYSGDVILFTDEFGQYGGIAKHESTVAYWLPLGTEVSDSVIGQLNNDSDGVFWDKYNGRFFATASIKTDANATVASSGIRYIAASVFLGKGWLYETGLATMPPN